MVFFLSRLVTFVSEPPPPTQPEALPTSSVYVSGVVTEPELIERSGRLETSLENQNVQEFCHLKLNEMAEEKDREVWNFIAANFEEDPKNRFLNLLGYDPSQVAEDVRALYHCYFHPFINEALIINLIRLVGECRVVFYFVHHSY
jgi:protein transport protein SEC31